MFSQQGLSQCSHFFPAFLHEQELVIHLDLLEQLQHRPSCNGLLLKEALLGGGFLAAVDMAETSSGAQAIYFGNLKTIQGS